MWGGEISSLIVVEDKTSPQFNIGANSTASVVFDVSKTGYTCVGIIGLWLSNGSLDMVEYYITSNQEASLYLYNQSSTALSNKTIKPTFLYVKNLSWG